MSWNPEWVISGELKNDSKINQLRNLFSTNLIVFALLGLAVVVDASGIAKAHFERGSLILGGVFAVAYFLGISGLLRFVIIRRPIGFVVAAFATLLLLVSWVLIQRIVQDDYRPSLLSTLCVIAAFKTLTYRDPPIGGDAEAVESKEESD